MNIFRLSWKNMLNRPLSTALSLILLTLGTGIISLMILISHHVQEQMEKNIRGTDMVVGAKGSPLQLILSAVFHIDAPTGNIRLEEARRLKKNPLVASAIPLSYGDSYGGYRIVGTEHAYPALYGAEISEGRLWQKSFEVTLGASVASNLVLSPGDTFAGVHGLSEGGDSHDAHAYRVTGIFKPTGSVIDRLILTATESVWEVHEHQEEEEVVDHQEKTEHQDDQLPEEGAHEGAHDHGNEEEKVITAMLIKFRSPMGLIQLPRMVNEKTSMQAAVPVYEISRLLGLLGTGIDTLNLLALIIMIVSGISVFISLYNAIRDRRYEMALMRVYGASRWQLAALVIQEGLLLSLTGGLLGLCLSRLGLWIISGLTAEKYPFHFSGLYLMQQEVFLLFVSAGIGFMAAIIPAVQVFTINLHKTLSDA